MCAFENLIFLNGLINGNYAYEQGKVSNNGQEQDFTPICGFLHAPSFGIGSNLNLKYSLSLVYRECPILGIDLKNSWRNSSRTMILSKTFLARKKQQLRALLKTIFEIVSCHSCPPIFQPGDSVRPLNMLYMRVSNISSISGCFVISIPTNTLLHLFKILKFFAQDSIN